MNFDLVRPCKNCPFSNKPGNVMTQSLGPLRTLEIVIAITSKDQSFSCHETNDFDDETGEAIETERSQHCAGAMIFLEKLGRPNQLMRIAGRLGSYDPDALDMEAPVYDGITDILEAAQIPTRPKPGLLHDQPRSARPTAQEEPEAQSARQ